MNIMESFSLKGKVALLTGGAGLYGRQIVAALAEAGAKLYIASRGVEALEKVAEEERKRGFDVTALSLDLENDKSIENLHDKIISENNRLDILVNNAVTRCACSGWDNTLEYYDKSLHVNASALFKITYLFAEDMKKQKGGSIINIASMMGMVGVEMENYEGTDMGKNQSPIYYYEKGGMINFTRWAASMLGPCNVRVNTISPGGLQDKSHPDAFVNNYSKRTQLGRMANSTDLKGAVVFLASDASLYITGANLPVDGGYTAK